MNRDLVYKTIREEILEQKKCQFQIFTASIALTSAILASAGIAKLGSLVYIAPMLLNTLALWMLIDKAISVQRKVGYLQMIEQYSAIEDWKWEADLAAFRIADRVPWTPANEKRAHSYVTMVGLMLIFLNAFCAALYFFGPNSQIAIVADPGRMLGWLDVFCVLILFFGIYKGWEKRETLISGENSTAAIQAKWKYVVKLSWISANSCPICGAIHPDPSRPSCIPTSTA